MAESADSDPPKWSLVQFALLCFYSVGFSGMTGFPFYIHNHTGMFLVAFYLLLVLICIPVCYVQIKLGSLYQRGLLGIFSHLVPILKGVAVALLLMTFFRCLTHGLELSYGLYFMFASLRQPFPWSDGHMNITIREPHTIYALTNSEDNFFVKSFLQRSDYIGTSTTLVWYILLCLLATWTCLYFMVAWGAATFGKILYIFTPVTFLTLTTVLIYGYVNVPGACDNLFSLFSQPSAYSTGSQSIGVISDQLGDPKVWIDSLDLHLFSLGLWSGILPTLGTHLRNKKMVMNLSWVILLVMHGMLPHLILVALAPYLGENKNEGWLANVKGVKPGLSFLFVTIPYSFEVQKLSPFISFCIYLMYFLLGLQHLSLHMLMIWENILPSVPKRVMIFFKRPSLMFAPVCFCCFLLSFPYASQCGIYLYMILRFYIDRLLFALVIFSMVPFIIGYVRQETLRMPIERLSMSLWYGLASLISACMLIYYFVMYVYQEAVVGYDQRWAEYIGWLASIAPFILGVILGAVHAIWKAEGTLQERILQCLKAGQLPEPAGSEEYTSAETGDTMINQVKTPLQGPEVQPLTPDVEVSIKPPENGEVARL
ncbi:sodium-dependent proline transporter-like [Gigantopelta aegis]|uniref:sodium-dependent proline transporter-like n=1 Tax=Gigantopelta aegis TaxID=1735272 RepID=UPI001B88BD8D|nr:sodium-dependent proline transporter-like [Gigantopelta aegis]